MNLLYAASLLLLVPALQEVRKADIVALIPERKKAPVPPEDLVERFAEDEDDIAEDEDDLWPASVQAEKQEQPASPDKTKVAALIRGTPPEAVPTPDRSDLKVAADDDPEAVIDAIMAKHFGEDDPETPKS